MKYTKGSVVNQLLQYNGDPSDRVCHVQHPTPWIIPWIVVTAWFISVIVNLLLKILLPDCLSINKRGSVLMHA